MTSNIIVGVPLPTSSKICQKIRSLRGSYSLSVDQSLPIMLVLGEMTVTSFDSKQLRQMVRNYAQRFLCDASSLSFPFKLAVFTSIKNWVGSRVLPTELHISNTVHKNAVQRDPRLGFEMVAGLEKYDQQRANNAQDVLEKLCKLAGIKVARSNVPGITVAQFPMSVYGSKTCHILDGLINPKFLEDPGNDPKLPPSRLEEKFEISEIVAMLTRHPKTGRKMTKPRVLCSVNMEN